MWGLAGLNKYSLRAILDLYLCEVSGVINAPKIRFNMLRAYHVYLSNRMLHIHMTPMAFFTIFSCSLHIRKMLYIRGDLWHTLHPPTKQSNKKSKLDVIVLSVGLKGLSLKISIFDFQFNPKTKVWLLLKSTLKIIFTW